LSQMPAARSNGARLIGDPDCTGAQLLPGKQLTQRLQPGMVTYAGRNAKETTRASSHRGGLGYLDSPP
jgi:hypothetical protein